MQRILVTGGAGFIGSNFIRHMLRKYDDYKIVNLDALTYAGNLDNLKDIENNPRYAFVKGNITDRKLIRHIVSDNISCIINFSAESHVDRSIKEPMVFVDTNVMGTQVLLDAAKENNVGRFIQISTDEVYGSLNENGYFTENTAISPNSPYSASKASADLLANAYYETYGLPVIITRCSNNYGYYQFPEKLIPLMIINACENKELPVYGDGKNIRDWLHVEDHCNAIDKVLHYGKPGEVYNIGGNNEKQNIEIVKFILNYMGKSELLIRYVEDRAGHDRRYAINANKIQRELGWKPEHTFEKGITETIEWYLNNKEWWEKLKV